MNAWGDDLLHEADQMRKRRLEDVLRRPYAIFSPTGNCEVIGFANTVALLSSAYRFLRCPELTEGAESRDDDHDGAALYRREGRAFVKVKP